MPDQRAADILTRFLDEQSHIKQYVDAALEMARIDHRMVRDINTTLKNVNIPFSLKLRRNLTLPEYSHSEIFVLSSSIDRIEPIVNEKITSYESSFDPEMKWSMAIPPKFETWYWEFLEYLGDQIGDNSVPVDREKMIQHYYDEKKENAPELGEKDVYDSLEEASIKSLIANAIEHIVQRRALLNLESLRRLKQYFANLRFAARLTAPSAEINVLRQGFILLVTAFDAAVFDIVRIALHNNLFELLPKFAKAENVTIAKLAASGSLEQFKDKLIDDILGEYYVRGLLQKVREVWAGFYKNDKAFHHLIEVVRRRNVHVHNRGIVGETYLDRDKKTGSPFFNVYAFNIGDYAPIDQSYWHDANCRCGDSVRRLTRWSKALPIEPAN